MSESREKRGPRQRSNGWKWAFFILLGFIIVLFGWLIWRLQPVEQETSPSETVSRVENEDLLTFQLSTEKEELNHLINLYLEKELGESYEDYTVSINNQVELAGTIEVVGFAVDFTLQLDPFVTENGNLQLRAEGIQLGSFDLPLSLTMNVLSQQLELPEWIRVDSEEEYILVALNEFELENGVHFTMDRINLEEDDIRMTVFLPDDAIK